MLNQVYPLSQNGKNLDFRRIRTNVRLLKKVPGAAGLGSALRSTRSLQASPISYPESVRRLLARNPKILLDSRVRIDRAELYVESRLGSMAISTSAEPQNPAISDMPTYGQIRTPLAACTRIAPALKKISLSIPEK
jgi:hypothetical protein